MVVSHGHKLADQWTMWSEGQKDQSEAYELSNQEMKES